VKGQIDTLFTGSKDWMTKAEIVNGPSIISFSVKGSQIYFDEIPHNLQRSLLSLIPTLNVNIQVSFLNINT
jgi:hypothetical protein